MMNELINDQNALGVFKYFNNQLSSVSICLYMW